MLLISFCVLAIVFLALTLRHTGTVAKSGR